MTYEKEIKSNDENELEIDESINENEEIDENTIPLYEIDTAPNDFNLLSYKEFIERGIFILPNFQRNYVWDMRRASKLIESLIMGLPIPQIFLFADEQNNQEKHIIIDGQQRLLSIIFFMKGRFPRDSKRIELRKQMFKNDETIDEDFLNNNEYCRDFKLNLTGNLNLNGKSYEELDTNIKNKFDLRTLRAIFIKQSKPKNTESEYASSMYEIFHRLNTGGMNLLPQEIRNTMISSDFYQLLEDLNDNETWRKILDKKNPDKYQKDKEIILRCIALSRNFDLYGSSMITFLNNFAEKTKEINKEELNVIKAKFEDLMRKIENVYKEYNKDFKIFFNEKNKKFHLIVFDAFFVACYGNDTIKITKEKIEKIKNIIKEDPNTNSIKYRINKAKKILED